MDIKGMIDECYFYLLLHEKHITELIQGKDSDGESFVDEPKGRLKFHLRFHEFMVSKYENKLSILYDKLRQQEKEEETIEGGGCESLGEVYDGGSEAMD